ncbi:MAG: enoyl-CoA hydratase/isomerase family protein [Chlorobiota bacterium]|nr:MAG: enoyl-CoA hydratase/isomerase family protein [Chlorobiota bacterium]
MEYNRLEIEIVDSVGTIWLNRPDKRNALDRLTVDEIIYAINDLSVNQNVRSIILSGRGLSFCAGADLNHLKSISNFNIVENLDDSKALAKAFFAIYNAPKPVIARVQGSAIAGGCGLMLACDIIVATENSKFGFTEVKIGFIPAIVSAFALRKCSQIQIRELLLTGKIISANDAFDKGLITKLVKNEIDLDLYINSLTEEILSTSYTSVLLTKQMLNTLDYTSLESALEYTSNLNALARNTNDCKNGINKFLNIV